MGVSLKLVNFDDLFKRNTTRVPIIINDFSESSEEDKESFNRMIYTKYATDLLSNLPTCECGELVGEHLVGVVCKACNTPVVSPLEQDLESLVWMRTPKGVTALINPIVWTMLTQKFTRSGFEIIRWICDTTYKPQVRTPPIMEAVQALGIERGFNNFVQNFDSIIEALFELKGIKVKKRGFNNLIQNVGSVIKAVVKLDLKNLKFNKDDEDPLQTLIRTQRDCIFSQFLPLPNRSLLVIEESNHGTYVDPIVVGAVDAIRTMVSIDSSLSSHNLRTKENRTIKTIAQLAEFYDDLARSTLAKKEGIFRKHVFGTRSHWSFRGVISSQTDAHYYDELSIPWGIGVSSLRIHLVSKLLRRGFTPNTAIAFLNEHAQKYHPVLDDLFKLLIDESPYKGIPVVFQRNPSLERGSAQSMFITKVKVDVDDPTVSLSILSVVGFNADKSFNSSSALSYSV
jgi:hypothetical protein